MDLSIIIVSWKVKEKLRENLQAIFASEGSIDFEVFVVDNNSEDDTVEMVKKEFQMVKLVENKDNLGFAKACNQGIRESKGDFVLLLNPDMKVMSDTFSNMIKWMQENKQASVAGSRLVSEKGETINHVRRFPTVWDQLAIILKLPHLFPGILNKYIRKDFDYNKASQVDSIRGGFMMIRQKTIKDVGTLDERYFVWFEEVDYCKQVKNAGGQVWYTPATKCTDYVGQSFKQLRRGQTQKYFQDSQLKYFKKWHSAFEYWALKIVWPIGIILTNVGEKLSIKSKAKT